MKKIILLLLFCSFLVTACKKNDDEASVSLQITSVKTVDVSTDDGGPRYQDEFLISSNTQVTGTVSNITVSTGTAAAFSAFFYQMKKKEYTYRVIRPGANIKSYHIEVTNGTETVDKDFNTGL